MLHTHQLDCEHKTQVHDVYHNTYNQPLILISDSEYIKNFLKSILRLQIVVFDTYNL